MDDGFLIRSPVHISSTIQDDSFRSSSLLMISKQLATSRNLSNTDVTKHHRRTSHTKKPSDDIQQFPRLSETLSIDTRTQCDEQLTSISIVTDSISPVQINPSTHPSRRLFPRSKESNHSVEKFILNEKMIHQPISSSIHNQLNAIDFLQERLQSEKKDTLIDLLYQIAHEINLEHHPERNYSHSAMNNNHFHVTPIWDGNLQLSNNKDKKNKNEKSNEQEKKDSNEKKSNKEDKKKEATDDNEIVGKKNKKKSKKVEETTTTDSENVVHAPVVVHSTREYPKSPRWPSNSPAETLAFSTLSVPVPQPASSFSSGFSALDRSRNNIPHQSNIAHLSQVQHQLQTDPQNSSSNRIRHLQDISVQQQLQSLSQMAHDGEEILITLNVNALTQKQGGNLNNTSPSPLQNNPYSYQASNQMIPPFTGTAIPRNLEIVAKGFARVKNAHSQSHLPTPSIFTPVYPMSCYSGADPPQMPIGPSIQPIFPAPDLTTSNGYARPPPYDTDLRNRSYRQCDSLCQSFFNKPDFRGRPSPGVTVNPFFFKPTSPSINHSAKSSSKHRKKQSSRKLPSHHLNLEHISRTSSSIY